MKNKPLVEPPCLTPRLEFTIAVCKIFLVVLYMAIIARSITRPQPASFFTGKSKSKSKITLIEGEEVITDDQRVADILNDYFIDAVKNLDIEKFYCEDVVVDSNESPEEKIERILMQYRSHPSIVMIKNKVKIEKT